MSSARALAAALLLVSLGVGSAAQSLGEVAEKDKSKRKKGAPAKVYTNDDLSKGAEPADKDKPPPRAPETPPAPSPPEKDSRGSEAQWRARAQSMRTAIGAAEARIKELETRIAAMGADVLPDNVADPFRLQSLEAQKAQAREELEKAKEALSRAQKDLEELEDEARRRGVPPGWLREQ